MAKCCSNQGLSDVDVHTHDEEGSVVFQIALWSDLWKSAAVNVVFQIALWSNLWQSAAVNVVLQIALWSDLWQSAAAIRGLSDVDVHSPTHQCCGSGMFIPDPGS